MPEFHGLALPDPYLDENRYFSLSESAARRWLDTLPKANLAECSRQLIRALIELNKVKCGYKERLAVLEVLRPDVHQTLKGMAPKYLNKPAVLPANVQQVVDRCNSLNSLLSNGYALALMQLEEKSLFSMGRNRLRELAIHRAISEKSQILLRCQQLHIQEERGFWLGLHQLYGFAKQHNLEDREVKDPVLGTSSLAACYLRPMMLATSNPFQLSQELLNTLFSVYPQWSEKVSFRGDTLEKWRGSEQGEPEDFGECLFVFSPEQDAPPVYGDLAKRGTGKVGIYIDDLLADLFLMRKGRASQRGNVELLPVSTVLLDHLTAVWSGIKQRRFDRVPHQGQVEIGFGFAPAHYFVSGEVPFDQFLQNLELPEGTQATVQFDGDQGVEHIDYGGSGRASAFGVSKRYQLHTVDLVDASSRGFCICLPEQTALHLRTEDLVCLREVGNEHWSIGVIRWVRQHAGKTYRAGIDLLGVAVQPTQAKLVRLDFAASKAKMAFVFPRDVLMNAPPRIMFQKNTYHPQEALLIDSPGQSLCIILQQRLESIGNYDLYEYELSELSRHQAEQLEPQESETDTSPGLSGS